MTTNNLTEQWEKGELESGLFYIKVKNNDKPIVAEYDKKTCFYTFRSIVRDLNKGDVGEVLAPVPSYEEWKELKDEAEIYHNNFKLMGRDLNLALENSDLKGLLRECRYHVLNNKTESEALGLNKAAQKFGELLTKINEVLK